MTFRIPYEIYAKASVVSKEKNKPSIFQKFATLGEKLSFCPNTREDGRFRRPWFPVLDDILLGFFPINM